MAAPFGSATAGVAGARDAISSAARSEHRRHEPLPPAVRPRRPARHPGASRAAFAFQIRRLLHGHFNKVHACAWSGDDTTCVSASQDSRLVVWNAFTEHKKDVLALRSNWIMCVALEREEGLLVASGGLDNTCTVHATSEAAQVAGDSPLAAAARAAASRGSGSGGSGGKQAVATFAGHEGYVADVEFWNGDHVLTASGDGTVALWDLTRGAAAASGTAEAEAAAAAGEEALSTSASGRWGLGGVSTRGLGGLGIGAGAGGATADAAGCAPVTVFSDHGADVMSVAINPLNPSIFATASCDRTMRVWDMRRKHSVRTFEGHSMELNAVEFFPSGLTVCTGSDDSSCRLFDLRSCGPVHVLSDECMQCGVTDIAPSRSGRLLFAAYEEPAAAAKGSKAGGGGGGGGGGAAASGEDLPCYILGWDVISSTGSFYKLRGNTARVSSLAVNPAGQALLAGCFDFDLTVWA